jgi:RimJ/RimL family protein N-acetyltransferase
MLPLEIRCDKSLLRPWRKSDRASLIEYANDREVWRNLRDIFPHPYTGAAADEFLEFAAAAPPPAGVYAIEVEGEAAGCIALEQGHDIERWSWEVGYWLGQRFWGRGIVAEALEALSAAAFRIPELIRIYAPVFSWNQRSMRVLEKAGYTREGVMRRGGIKDGIVIDRVVYARVRDTGLPYSPFPGVLSSP